MFYKKRTNRTAYTWNAFCPNCTLVNWIERFLCPEPVARKFDNSPQGCSSCFVERKSVSKRKKIVSPDEFDVRLNFTLGFILASSTQGSVQLCCQRCLISSRRVIHAYVMHVFISTNLCSFMWNLFWILPLPPFPSLIC